MLVYESTAQLLAEPPARRYLHTMLLTALRDNATRVEVRFGDDAGMLYYRVDGRDWELAPPPDDVYPLLKQAVRDVARLVQPERPVTGTEARMAPRLSMACARSECTPSGTAAQVKR